MKRLCLIIFIMILMCGCSKKDKNQLVMVTEAGLLHMNIMKMVKL